MGMLLAQMLNRFRRRLPPRQDKEEWEFRWQRDTWAKDFAHPENQQKVLEYWRTHRHLDEILERVRPTAETRILDVGCGISTVLHYLPGERFGVDPLAERYLEIYSYPADLRIMNAYAESLPFPDGDFDFVTCSNCIDHTEQPTQAIEEMRRVLQPDGWLLLTCEVHSKDRGTRNNGHPHTMTQRKFEELLSGWQIDSRWSSPWIGLSRYVRGEPPTAQTEMIVLAKPPLRSCR